MKICFLLDENVSPKLKRAVKRLNPEIDILRVGDPSTPSLGTLDPELLTYLELSQRLLVTDNRSSMPEHLANHWEAGGHMWGVVGLRPSGTIERWAEAMVLMWEITESEEWVDRRDWIPF